MNGTLMGAALAVGPQAYLDWTSSSSNEEFYRKSAESQPTNVAAFAVGAIVTFGLGFVGTPLVAVIAIGWGLVYSPNMPWRRPVEIKWRRKQSRNTCHNEHYLRSRRTNGQAGIHSYIFTHRDPWRYGASKLFGWLVDLRVLIASGFYLYALYKIYM